MIVIVILILILKMILMGPMHLTSATDLQDPKPGTAATLLRCAAMLLVRDTQPGSGEDHMEVSRNGGIYQSSIFYCFFLYKPTSLGYPQVRNPPYGEIEWDMFHQLPVGSEALAAVSKALVLPWPKSTGWRLKNWSDGLRPERS